MTRPPLKVPTEGKAWDFESLLTVEELERTGLRKRLHEVQNACCTEQRVVPLSVFDVINLASKAVSVWKIQVALLQVIARMVEGVGRLLKGLGDERHRMDVYGSREQTIKAQTAESSAEMQAKQDAISQATQHAA